MLGGNHWLRTVATRAGLPGADDLRIPPGTAPADAWAVACRSLGTDESTLAQHVARHFRLTVADTGAAMANALRLVPEAVVRKHLVLPLRESDRDVRVATCDPTDFAAEQALGFATGRTPVFEIAGPSELRAAIERHYAADMVVEPLLGNVPAAQEPEVRVASSSAEVAAAHEGESAGVVRLTNLILRSAVAQRASLIEIGPGRSGGLVEFEVDAVRQHFMHMPLPAMNHVLQRIQVLGNVGFGARARSQDGSATLNVDGRPYELRISILPARTASKAVIRIFDNDWQPHLADLSFSDQVLTRIRALLAAETGLVILASPERAGATTTFYAALRDVVARTNGIVTVEDPVERPVAGVDQTMVDRRTGRTVDATLRSVLRNARSVVGIGRADDADTLRLAATAAEDRLVIAVVKGDDPFTLVESLIAANVPHGQIAGVLRGVVAQRLVRRACDACAQPATEPLTADEIRQERAYGVRPTVRSVGCERCNGTGFRGLLPVAQVLLVTRRLAELIAAGASAAQLERSATDVGMRTLLDAARARVGAGLTTLQEVERVLGPARPAALSEELPVVLVADDDPETRLLAGAILEQQGMRAVEAANGEEAVARVGDGREFALLILDLDMPVLDGRQALKRLKSSVATAGLPVVVLTGSQNPADERLVMDEGAADYIRKPIDPPRFLARVRAVLNRQGADSAEASA